MVRVAGVEPARCCHQRILSPSRLPIPTHRLNKISLYVKPVEKASVFFIISNLYSFAGTEYVSKITVLCFAVPLRRKAHKAARKRAVHALCGKQLRAAGADLFHLFPSFTRKERIAQAVGLDAQRQRVPFPGRTQSRSRSAYRPRGGAA